MGHYTGSDGHHPSNFELDEDVDRKLNSGEMSSEQRFEEDFIPPWNTIELDALLLAESSER